MDDQAGAVEGQLERELGPDLAAAFIALGQEIAGGPRVDQDRFRSAAFAYFDAEHAAGRNPDPFFNWVGVIALPRAGTPLALTGLWESMIGIALDWEADRGLHHHKGTGYYFAGVRDIAMGDIDRGSLYMHQAAAEDTYPDRDRIPESPAGWFITLDASRANQAYHQKVVEYEAYVEEQLAAYRAASLGVLTLDEMRARYIGGGLLEAGAMLAHAVARLTRLSLARIRPIVDNRVGTLLLAQIALELCLVVEGVMKRRIGAALAFGGLIARYPAGHDIAMSTNLIGELNALASAPASFDAAVSELISGGPVTSLTRALTPREMNSALAMLIRNKAAHGLDLPEAVVREFDAIVTRIFFALFAAIEDLY